MPFAGRSFAFSHAANAAAIRLTTTGVNVPPIVPRMPETPIISASMRQILSQNHKTATPQAVGQHYSFACRPGKAMILPTDVLPARQHVRVYVPSDVTAFDVLRVRCAPPEVSVSRVE